jgi:hypothetical protein
MEGFALDEQHGTPGGTSDAEDTPSTTDSSGWDQLPTFVEPVYASPNPPEPDASTTVDQTTSRNTTEDSSEDPTAVDSHPLPSYAGDPPLPDTEQASLVPGEPNGGSSPVDISVTPTVGQDWLPVSPNTSLPSPVPLPYDQEPGMAAPPTPNYPPPPPPAFPGTPAGAYAPPINPSQPLYAPPPVNPSQPLYAPSPRVGYVPPPPPPGAPAGYLPPPPGYGAYPHPGVPMVVAGRPEHPSRTAAIITEVILDLFGIYGVGWLIAGETTVGILLLVGSFIWWPIALILTLVTGGIGLICFFPLWVAFLLLSVILLSQRTAARPY